ncbi:unnamed protein product [Brachionus calyciflorus]|uniref:Paramyosin n=1 Tax=Brachionus calyciflorus TaxID=104777 RepID=A0A813NKP0_9BILA|nr:unnamed protein product [Brachionus calyciflorus]
MSEILLHTKLRELEEELKVEKEYRFKYEKELSNLRVDYGDLQAQFEEALTVRDREVDVSKRLRQEITDLKQKIDLSHAENEESTLLLKRKHQEQINEISAHLEQLSKSKLKFEKENKSFLHQVDDLRKDNDNMARSKAQALNSLKDLENKHIEATQRIDDLLKQLNEVNELKNKLAKEHSELYRRNSSIEFEFQQLSLNSKRLNQELDDARMQLENEILVRNTLENKSRNLQVDLDNAQAQLEEETESRIELNKQLIRSQDEFKANKEKIEKECQARIEDVEDSKRKLNNRYLELQDQYTDLMNKYSNNEKAKLRLQNQVDTMTVDLDKTRKRADDAVKHEKALEKENEELRTKLGIANGELDAAYQAARNHQSELSKYKHLSTQLSEQLDALQKDKRRISDELETTNNQFLDVQSRLTESERRLKTLEADRNQLENDYEDTRDAYDLEVQRSQNLQAQYDKLKMDSDKKIAEKDEEIDLQRSTHRRQLESAQSQLQEAENRHKGDLNNQRKKHQVELEDLRAKYEGAKKAKLETENQYKKLQQSHKEVLDRLTEEQHMHDATRDQLSAAEKRASSLRAETEETKSLYERLDKTKKALEMELHDIEDKLNETQAACNRAIAEKKKYESDAISASDELHEIKYELRASDEKIRNLNANLLKKDEDLRHDKEIISELDASRKALEQQLRDTQTRIEEAEEFAKREAKRLNSKLETRLAQLETELDLERAKEQEMAKELRRLEKRNKDLLDQIGDEQAKLMAMTDAYDKIHDKMKKFKGQIELSEEQAAANSSKCKRLQKELEDAEERAESIARTFARGSSVQRNTDNYDSDYESAEHTSTTSTSHAAPYLRTSYLYSKPTNIDDFSLSSHKASSGTPWRNKYKSIDIDDDDILIQPRYNKYSTNSLRSRVWSYGSGRSDRARSVAHIYDQEVAMNSIRDNKSKSNLYASRNSVSRVFEDNDESLLKTSPRQPSILGKYLDLDSDTAPSLSYNKKSKTPDFRSDNIDKRISLASEHSTIPSAEQDLE